MAKRKRPFSRPRKKDGAGEQAAAGAAETQAEVSKEELHLRDRQRKLREIALKERALGREYRKAKWRRTIK